MSPLGRRKRSRLERSIALRRLRFERVVALREEARKTWDKIEPGVTVNIRHQRDYGDTEAGETSFTKSYLKGESWYELGLIVRAGASLCQYVAIIEYPARHLLETAANILTRIQDNEEASHPDEGGNQSDPPVLIQIGQVSEDSEESPLAVIKSVVWLKRLHMVSNVRSDIPKAQGFDVKLGRPIEDGELGVLVIDRRIDRSGRISEVIEGGTEIVNEIAEDQGDVGDGCRRMTPYQLYSLRSLSNSRRVP